MSVRGIQWLLQGRGWTWWALVFITVTITFISSNILIVVDAVIGFRRVIVGRERALGMEKRRATEKKDMNL